MGYEQLRKMKARQRKKKVMMQMNAVVADSEKHVEDIVAKMQTGKYSSQS